MRRVTWRNLVARKVRLFLSAFAIVLGIAFLSGSLVFTDTIGESFDQIAYGTVTDVAVRPETGNDDAIAMSVNREARSIPASYVDEVAALPGVARAEGAVNGGGLFVIKKNNRLLGGTGAPTIALNAGSENPIPNAAGDQMLQWEQGRAPDKDGEIALDARSAEVAGYRLGDTVKIALPSEPPIIKTKLVGIFDFSSGGLAGATLVIFDDASAQRYFLDGKDAFSIIQIEAASGATQREVADQVAKVIPAGTEAVTGDAVAEESKNLFDQLLGFLNTFLLVFAGIALVVGTFLIVNTFSILVAQRSRELALLRALGASRPQVSRSVLTEAFVIGVIGSTLGLGMGFGLAMLLKTLFSRFGLDLSGTSLVFEPRTIVLAYAVGVLVTMLAAWIPARRAGRVPPVAAMRDEVAMPESSLRWRIAIALLFGLAGAASMSAGSWLDVPRPIIWVGVGIFGVLMAVALGSPIIASPVLAAFGLVYRTIYKSVGQLAAQNARRNPRRTAATASALMIGLALVTTMSILGASINTSIDKGVEREFSADFIVQSVSGQPFSPEISQKISEVPGVAAASPAQSIVFKADGTQVFASATDAEQFSKVFKLDFADGAAPTGENTIALSESMAASLGRKTGDAVKLAFGSGEFDATVSGVYADSNLVNQAVVPLTTVAAAGIKRGDTSLAINAAPGTGTRTVRANLERAVGDNPTIVVQDKESYAEAQRSQVNTLLYLIYALLGLAIVIAVLGIINTLALSVIERTREIGLLRAVGLTRPQLRRMVRLESVAIAILGAVLGIGAGLLFGVALQRSFQNDGISDLAIPAGSLAVFVVVSALVGVLAAVVPARRAAKLDVLKAITGE
ncbi:ABC transporter permease [Aeromicrobium duanguangcaii]|uniref:FtsX-like permease family protein n=1 Tax=Aeromicrobium duanguangcaii TaxID=2968086 RepID=A0ABY5KDG5_9ACTN|nr:FtsX-like permease family protein [Aeromicrobium duanguangcaii]MCD9154437.1 FtsX-like permease family protein [Aeromicrobium duanguangcaii]UUI68502.1 FtsX-like permease family protein [Aeromicrobium duanguangcaii]